MVYLSRFQIRQEFTDPALFVSNQTEDQSKTKKYHTYTRWPGDNSNTSFRNRSSKKKYIKNKIKML